MLQFALALLFAISGCTRTEVGVEVDALPNESVMTPQQGVESDESTEASVSPGLWIDEGAAEIINEQFDDGADHIFVIRWEAGALRGFAKLANADRDKSEVQKHVSATILSRSFQS